jgi:two-component system nitrogen regulation response regulator GlnG
LQSVLKQALLQASGPALLPAFLPPFPEEPPRPETTPGSAPEEPGLDGFIGHCLGEDHDGDLYAEIHRRVDRLLLTRILEQTGGNQHQAARRLGIARETLRRRLRELGLQLTRQLEPEEGPQA